MRAFYRVGRGSVPPVFDPQPGCSATVGMSAAGMLPAAGMPAVGMLPAAGMSAVGMLPAAGFPRC
ncbi:MAG: hypothetical protein ACRDIA_06555 [Actinomycetota bacterium]